MIADKDLLSIQQARILAENAFEAQKKLACFTQDKLDCIVEEVADEVGRHCRDLAFLAWEESEYGRWQDKLVKNRFVCTRLREQLRAMRCVGVIGDDSEKGVLDIGVPVGVIAALCPAANAVAATINKTLLAIKSGNAIVFSPHPGATKSMATVLDIMIRAASSAGLPEGCLSYMSAVTKSGTRELMEHRAVSLIMVTEVPAMLKTALCAAKPLIYGGTGNGPAYVERSADIARAASDIVRSKCFDNGISPSAEQSIVVDSCISKEMRQALEKKGAYFMTDQESVRLAKLFFCPDGKYHKRMVGVSAAELAHRAGLDAPANVRLLVAGRKYVSEADPYSRGFLAPVLAYYEEDNWEYACEKCIELLLHERNAHTLVIHSKNEEVILQFALKKPVGRLLINTPSAFGGIGWTSNLFPAMTLGSGSAGYGITSDNVSPMNLVYIRKVGYGLGQRAVVDAADAARAPHKDCPPAPTPTSYPETLKAISRILAEAVKAVSESSCK